MIAVDTNILARYYVDDPADPEGARQRPVAERLMRESPAIFVPVTVVLELAWVLRAFYAFGPEDCARVMEHLAGLPNVAVEDWAMVLEAARLHRAGLDFADALHLTRSSRCERLCTFDDKKFARRAQKLVALPRVEVAG
ncbi:MAG: type II toxin-antitoxin system VapC family toxin [Rhodocyclaceae bacterium]|nr:type II toxin-antitoxin system VapC family toxin [Rhodocyclaceae bacterium]